MNFWKTFKNRKQKEEKKGCRRQRRWTFEYSILSHDTSSFAASYGTCSHSIYYLSINKRDSFWLKGQQCNKFNQNIYRKPQSAS